MPSAHSNQEAFNVTKQLKNFTIVDDSTYDSDNHAKLYFNKYLIVIVTPDGTTLYYSSYNFSLGDYTTIQSPSNYLTSALSNTINQFGLGVYSISVYSIPTTGAGGNEYGLDDCFFRVADSKIYKVVAAGGVDIAVDTTFTDATKYAVIDILSVTERYKASASVFILDYATRNCVTNKLQPAKCLIEDYPCNGDYCSNTIFVNATDIVMAIDMVEFLNNTDAEIDATETVAFLNTLCAEDSCGDDGITTMPLASSDCGCECEDEDIVDNSEPEFDRMMGLRKKTDAVDIQVVGQPKQRVFTDLIDIPEDDIISVTVGDVEWSFETEITSWDSTTGTMTFAGKLPENIDSKPVWIRIQYIVRAS